LRCRECGLDTIEPSVGRGERSAVTLVNAGCCQSSRLHHTRVRPRRNYLNDSYDYSTLDPGGGTGMFRAAMPTSMARTTDSATFTLVHRLSSASTMTHGAAA